MEIIDPIENWKKEQSLGQDNKMLVNLSLVAGILLIVSAIYYQNLYTDTFKVYPFIESAKKDTGRDNL